MSNLVEIDDTAVRFRRPPSIDPKEMWLPGVIDVEFQHDLPTNVLTSIASHVPGLPATLAGIDLSVKSFLENQNLLDATFTLHHNPAALGTPTPHGLFHISSASRFITFHFPHDRDVIDLATKMKEFSSVARAVPVPRLTPAGTPLNEPFLQDQWYIQRCGFDQAWNTATGTGVIVADIDWGFDLDHQDLAGRVSLRFNAVHGGADVSHSAESSLLAHGTAVIGLIGAADNDIGMVGTAFNSTLWAIQGGDDNVTSVPEDWVKAIHFVCNQASNQRKVIALEIQTQSLRDVEMNPKINQAIKDAIGLGVVVCVPAGNRGVDASLDDLGQLIPETGSILVGATDFDVNQNPRSGDSNFGSRVTIFAPGDSMDDFTTSIGPTDSYRFEFGGTSGATAKVAGAVALMLQINENLQPDQVKTILRASGRPMADDPPGSHHLFLSVPEALGMAANA